MNEFKIYNIAEDMYQLVDLLGFSATLVVGSKKAMLIDTMSGTGDVLAAVQSITSLPLIVANTHGHFDHSGGNNAFDAVWISDLELPFSPYTDTKQKQIAIFEDCAKRGLLVVQSQDLQRIEERTSAEYLSLCAGNVFDLGNTQLRAVKLAGHTAGSMGFLLENKQMLISGDAMTSMACLFFPDSLGVDEYIKTLEYALSLDFTRFVPGHSLACVEKSILHKYLECAQSIGSMRSMKFHYDIIPEYSGRLYLYQEKPDLIGIILKKETT